jgi:hypothetical protein
MADLLGNVRVKPELLIPADNREIAKFTVSLVRPMGVKRGTGKNAFIDSVLKTLDDFYADVVQNLREWQSPAPQLGKAEPVEIDDVPDPAKVEPSTFSGEETPQPDEPSTKNLPLTDSPMGEESVNRELIDQPEAQDESMKTKTP